MKANTEISFYHLALPLERVMPKLLDKIIASQQKCVIMLKDEERLKVIDNALWTYGGKSFLPHGSKNDPHPNLQPIYLTCELDNPNDATVLISVDGIRPPHLRNFSKFLDLVSTADYLDAKQRYNFYMESGFPISSWKQNAQGNWDKDC